MASAVLKAAAMRRVMPKQARRQQLIKATIKSIARNGLSGTTMADITREAGLSLGIVNLHFESKEKLLLETLRSVADEYKTGLDKIFRDETKTNVEKLVAHVEYDFSKNIVARNKLAVWFAFWGEVATRNIYKKLVSKSDEQYLQIIKSLIFQLNEDESQAEIIAIGLSSMIVGLWMDFNIGVEDFDRELAKQTCMNYLHALFPEHF